MNTPSKKNNAPPSPRPLGREAAPEPHAQDEAFESEPQLFDGEGELFVEIASNARVYGEYGMGASTLWVAKETKAPIIAVDTSADWVDRTRASLGASERFHLTWVDVGPIGDWGMPLGFSRRHAFRAYVEAPWAEDAQPDVVLIDGRFRLSCWFESVIRAQPGTRLVFDDYTDRPTYHVVEEFLKPERVTTRQALFVVPDGLDLTPLAAARDAFLMVRD